MATLNQTAVSKDAFAVLQRTIESNVLEELREPLARIVHGAIQKGVVAASQTPPVAVDPTQPAKEAAQPTAQPAARPVEGGLCAKVWDALDKATVDAKGTLPTLQDVQKLAKRKRWNANTARVQYYRWRSTQPAASAS